MCESVGDQAVTDFLHILGKGGLGDGHGSGEIRVVEGVPIGKDRSYKAFVCLFSHSSCQIVGDDPVCANRERGTVLLGASNR